MRSIFSFSKSLLLLFIFLCGKSYPNIQETIAYAKKNLIKQNSEDRIFTTLFCPDKEPDAKKILLGIIENEKESIKLAQFIITEKDILEALIRAKRRGVKISIVSDKSCLDQKNEKLTQLKNEGIEVNVYRKYYSTMHHKFFIFGKNFYNKALVWVGSANSTFSAYRRNQESIVIFNDVVGIKNFKDHFFQLRNEVLSNIKSIEDKVELGFHKIMHDKKLQKNIKKGIVRLVMRK